MLLVTVFAYGWLLYVYIALNVHKCKLVLQKRVVNVYRLITRGTLEEKIMGLQKFKMNIANTVISQENTSLQSMGTDQLLDLFTLDKVKSSSYLSWVMLQVLGHSCWGHDDVWYNLKLNLVIYNRVASDLYLKYLHINGMQKEAILFPLQLACLLLSIDSFVSCRQHACPLENRSDSGNLESRTKGTRGEGQVVHVIERRNNCPGRQELGRNRIKGAGGGIRRR